MNFTKLAGRLGAAALAGLMVVGMAGPVEAAQRDLDILQSYVGDWRGRGTMGEGDAEETVVCKLDITRSSSEKINFKGRCTLAGKALAINGTMAYLSQNRRFEAVMSSNTYFSGVAIGHRSGSTIKFNLSERDPDTGSTVKINIGMALTNSTININFRLTDSASGQSTVAKVPFTK